MAAALETVLRNDRAVVVAGLGTVTLLSWAYLVSGAGMSMDGASMGSTAMGGGVMSGMQAHAAWSAGYAAVVFVMWWVMMVAMMLPSAAPTILLFARISRTQRDAGKPFIPTGAFAAGYLLVWGGFSAAATALQWLLAKSGLISMMMDSVSLALSAAILLAAGLWQLTPLKRACLRHCRSPMHFVAQGFRPGTAGALSMGAEHGAYCLGCCWFLMALLFYGGVMNLYWILGLTIYVLVEKVVPAGEWIGRAAGVGLVAWGGALLAGLV